MKELETELFNLIYSKFKEIKNYTLFFELWSKIMIRFSEIIKIKKFENNILFVEVFDSRFLQELNLSSNLIIENLIRNGLRNFNLNKIVFFYGKRKKLYKTSKLLSNNNLNKLKFNENKEEFLFAKNHVFNLNFKNMFIANSLLDIYKKYI